MPGPSERDIVVDVTIKSDTRGARMAAASLGDVEKGADRASRAMRSMTQDSKVLGLEIQRTRRHIAELGLEFTRTKDKTLFADLTKERAYLRQLERIADESDQILGNRGRNVDLVDAPNIRPRWMGIGALVEVAAMAAPLIGAMVAGAVIGGVGIGGIVGGTVAAAKDPRVKEAYSDLFGQMGRDIKDDASVLIDPLIHAADIFDDKWRETSLRLEQFFRTLAPGVGPLAEGLAGFANEVLGGLQTAAEAAVPILEDMKDLLPELGKAVSDFFEMLADPDTGAREGFKDLITVTGGAVRGLGAVISGLSESWNDFRGMPDWVKIASLAVPSIGLTAGTINFLKNATENYKASLIETGHAQGDLNPVFQASIDNLDNMRQNFNRAQHAAELFDKAIDDSYSSFLDWTGAEINVEDALDDLQESLKVNGTTLDVHTEKGRENLRNLKDYAEGAIDAAKAKYIETDSVIEADKVYEGYRQALFDTFIAAGKTREEAQKLTDQWLAMEKLEDIVKNFTVNVRRVTFGPSVAQFGGGLQEFAEGGMVKGPPGSKQLVWAHAGERVLNQEQQYAMAMGGQPSGSTAVTVGFSGNTDSAFAAAFMKLVRNGQITIASRAVTA